MASLINLCHSPTPGCRFEGGLSTRRRLRWTGYGSPPAGSRRPLSRNSAGFRASGFGFRFSGLRFWGFRFRVSGFGFRVSGFGFGFRCSGFGFRFPVSGFRVQGSGCMVQVSGSQQKQPNPQSLLLAVGSVDRIHPENARKSGSHGAQ